MELYVFKQNSLQLYKAPSPLDSILLAMFTVSPNRQYLGMVRPTTPAAHPPLCIPLRSRKRYSGRWRTYQRKTSNLQKKLSHNFLLHLMQNLASDYILVATH